MSLAVRAVAACFAVSLALAPAAGAADLDDLSDQWLPRSDGAEWVYEWSNSDYSAAPQRERYRVVSRAGTAFRIQWEQLDTPQGATPSQGQMDFQHTGAGLVNTNYQSTQPPPSFPVLCASATDCGNSVAGPLYLLIWGTRSPVLAEPLLSGTRWNATGGAANDVASANRYVGHASVTVPAFPGGVRAAEIRSEVTQAGALGDPFGSGVRTTYWVRGVGPVKIVFRHAGGETSEATLQSTNLRPLPLPPEENLLPLNRGDTSVLRWRNSRHMRNWSTQRFQVAEVLNSSARVDVKHVSGPIRVTGSYTFSTRLDGVTHLAAFTRAASRASFPALGPRFQPQANRRRFFTPYDLMVYGFGPVAPVYAEKGESWRSSRDSRDWEIWGVTGRSEIVSAKSRVRVRGKRYRAVKIRSTLSQAGYRFGSGTRTSWFVPGRGLVKLVFRHRDGSVSTVQRVR
jgi:hypothetical protein